MFQQTNIQTKTHFSGGRDFKAGSGKATSQEEENVFNVFDSVTKYNLHLNVEPYLQTERIEFIQFSVNHTMQ